MALIDETQRIQKVLIWSSDSPRIYLPKFPLISFDCPIHPNDFLLSGPLFPPGHLLPQWMALSVPLTGINQVPALSASPVPFRRSGRNIQVFGTHPAPRTLPPPPLEGTAHSADEDEVGVVGVGSPVAKDAFVVRTEVGEYVVHVERTALFDDVFVAFDPFVLR